MKISIVAIFLLLLAALMMRLGGGPAEADLVFIIRGDVFTLDPQRMSYIKDFRMAHALYEGAVRWKNDDFTVEPAAAAVMPEISADGLRYRITLRPDARWSNGDPVVATDFRYAWFRALLPDTAADYTNLFFAIDGAEAFFTWRREQTEAFARASSGPNDDERAADALALWSETIARFDDTVGIDVIDEHTIEITLTRPVPYFLDLLCFPVFFPVHQPSVEGWPGGAADPPPFAERRFLDLDIATGRVRQDHGWARPGLLVTNGPYVLDEWRYRRDMRLVRNSHYHTPARVRSESVLALTIEDTNTAVLAYATGSIDWLSDVNAEYQADMLAERRAYENRHAAALEQLITDGHSLDEALALLPPPGKGERRDIHAFPTFGTEFYSFNCRPALAGDRTNPFADAAVRRAFTMTVNRREIVEQVTRLHEPIATTFIPPGSIPGYESPQGLTHDPDNGRRELEAAGWRDRDDDGILENEAGERFPVVDLLYTTNAPRDKWIALRLAEQWERELGVEVEPRGEDTKFYKEDVKEGGFMIARGRWYGDYGDPTTFLDLFRTNNGNNDRGFSHPEIDRMLAESDTLDDGDERMRLLASVEEQLFNEHAPMVVLCQLLQVYMYDPEELTGISRHPRLTQYLWQMESQQ